MAQYMAALRKHSKRCEFGDYLEQALRDRLVCGLQSEIVQSRLLSEKDLTLQKAYNPAHSLETVSHRASELQASAKATTQVQTSEWHQEDPQMQMCPASMLLQKEAQSQPQLLSPRSMG